MVRLYWPEAEDHGLPAYYNSFASGWNQARWLAKQNYPCQGAVIKLERNRRADHIEWRSLCNTKENAN